MHVEGLFGLFGLFGLMSLGTVLFSIQMLTKKGIFDIPMIIGAFFCWGGAGYGFFKLAFGA